MILPIDAAAKVVDSQSNYVLGNVTDVPTNGTHATNGTSSSWCGKRDIQECVSQSVITAVGIITGLVALIGIFAKLYGCIETKCIENVYGK